jgi:hypothetical protein
MMVRGLALLGVLLPLIAAPLLAQQPNTGDPELAVAAYLAAERHLLRPVAFDLARSLEGGRPRSRVRARKIALMLDSAEVVQAALRRRTGCTLEKFWTLVRMEGPRTVSGDGRTILVSTYYCDRGPGGPARRVDEEFTVERQNGWVVTSSRVRART